MLLASLAIAACGQASSNTDRAQTDQQCTELRVTHEVWESLRTEPQSGEELSDLQQLADRLVACKTLIGKRYSWIKATLGQPDDGTEEQRSIAYILGSERGALGLDDDILVLDLGPDLRVTGTMVSG